MTSFDERAREWDTQERIDRAAVMADVIRRHVPVPADGRIVDLGAGTGLLGLALRGETGTGTLVLAEPSEGMRQVAAEKVAALGIRDVEIVPLDLGAGAGAGEPFDLAVSLLVLHHVPDTVAVLATVHDLLRPGGWMALADLDAEDGTFHDPDAEGIHHRGFARDHVEDLARAAGFTEVATHDAVSIEHERGTYPLFLLVGRRA
ncbi:MAG: class I SAM-dependent methyltransferase [Chloroflexota bacterium]